MKVSTPMAAVSIVGAYCLSLPALVSAQQTSHPAAKAAPIAQAKAAPIKAAPAKAVPATAVSTPAVASAQTKTAKAKPSLASQAKISLDSARVLALAVVPTGTVKSSELEREHGKLIYSFDITVPNKTGVEEVNISAINGKLVAHKHESPKAEKKEAAKAKS